MPAIPPGSSFFRFLPFGLLPRCVRRAFFAGATPFPGLLQKSPRLDCGSDPAIGRVFAVDVAGYGVMSNYLSRWLSLGASQCRLPVCPGGLAPRGRATARQFRCRVSGCYD